MVFRQVAPLSKHSYSVLLQHGHTGPALSAFVDAVQLLKEQDAHKEEVKKLNDKLREKDKRALDDKRQIEALRRQVGGGRGATSTMRMEEDAGFNPQVRMQLLLLL